jgi:Predicted membrane protein
MQKTAQKRSVLNKLREMTNVSGIAAEKFFNPEFKKVMESLRAKDDEIRSIVSGEDIGEGSAGSDPMSAKSILKSARSNFNRREYMSSIADLSRFHKKAIDVVMVIRSLNKDVDAVHHEFLYKDLPEDKIKHLNDLKQRFAATQAQLIKEAGIADFLVNIGTKRGRALALWEKRYPEKTKKLKNSIESLLKDSDTFLDKLLLHLKEMASARSTRNVDVYVGKANDILSSYSKYDNSFKNQYNTVLKPFLAEVEFLTPKAPEPAPAPKLETEKIKTTFGPDIDTGMPVENQPPKLELAVDPMELRRQKLQQLQNQAPPQLELAFPPGQGVPPTAPMTAKPVTVPAAPIPEAFVTPAPVAAPVATPAPVEEPAPITERSPQVKPAPKPAEQPKPAKPVGKKKSQHDNFINSLESLSNEHPQILANYISKYASSIQSTDPNTAIKLLKIVKNIRG